MAGMSADQFTRRLVTLCLRSQIIGLPTKAIDRHILFQSILLTLEPARTYNQAELTAALNVWLCDIGRRIETDHAALRRHLVDEGYLQRTPDGRSYRAAASPGSHDRFAADVEDIDVRAAITAGLEGIAARRREFGHGAEHSK